MRVMTGQVHPELHMQGPGPLGVGLLGCLVLAVLQLNPELLIFTTFPITLHFVELRFKPVNTKVLTL